jgi:hypothetical protein
LVDAEILRDARKWNMVLGCGCGRKINGTRVVYMPDSSGMI